MSILRLCVTGSRHWSAPEVVWQRLDQLLEEHPDLEVAHGASPGGGVDLFVAQWCENHKDVPVWPFPVRAGGTGIDGNWPYAGNNRNVRMLRTFVPDMVLGFRASGKSSGTDHCLNAAEQMGVPRVEIVYLGLLGDTHTFTT